MKSTITTLSPVKRELDIELAAEAVGPAFDKIVESYGRRVKVAGFRAGHAPRDMIKRMFPEELRRALLDELAPAALGESLKEHGLHPVTVPVLHDIQFEEGQFLRFKAVVETWPEFELPEYRKLKLKKVEAAVEEAEVERALDELRQKAAEFVPVEGRGAAEGDYVVVEWKGRELKSKRLLPTERAVVMAGHAENEPKLNENLAGLKPGEEREFQIDHPADHSSRKVAGKSILYRMKVLNIKEKKLPELSDDLAKSVGEVETLAELKDRIRTEILKSREKAARNEMAEEALTSLSESLNLELPESLAEAEYQSLLRRRFGASVEEIEAKLPAESWNEIMTETRAKARRNLLNHMILSKIAQKERISVSEEELDEELKSTAAAGRVPLARLRDSLEKEGRLDEVRETLALRKAIDFLVNEAIIK